MVKAMAPKAPMGASFMMYADDARTARASDFSMKSNTSVPRPPNLCSAKPNITANSSTCRISPLAKASTTVFGIMLSRKSVVLCILPGPV